MIPTPYNYVAAVLVVGASLGAAFLYGQHTVTVSAERDALKSEVTLRQRLDAQAVQLRGADEALYREQQRVAAVRRVEVVKHVTKYRTKLVDRPVVIECINDSGLLDLINSTTPTATAE